MDKEIKPQCPLLKVACLGQGCAWYCIFEKEGMMKNPERCAVQALAYTIKALSLRPPGRI
jgi:hypothetical protein